MSNSSVTNDKLNALIKLLGSMPKEVRVGILGAKAAREGELTNAEIGAIHEFGGDIMPQRSFLKMPIDEKLGEYLEKSKMIDKDTLDKMIKEKAPDYISKRIGQLAVKASIEAFATGGFGKWLPSQDENDTGLTLVETQQLRNSITFEVVQ